MEMYDCVIVGAGLSGGVIARKLAEEKGKRVLILERRNHMAGNTYDFEDEHGVKVQKYGPHVFHTNSEIVYNFITKYCEAIPYKTKCEAVIEHISTPSPFNFTTIDQFYSEDESRKLKEELLRYYNHRPSVTVVEMLESNNKQIHDFAQFLFDKDYKLYTAKQWNVEASEIDPSVLKRVPIVLSYGDTYFYDKYEFMPKGGFTSLYKSIVEHPNITILLNEDALGYLSIDDRKHRVLFDGQEVCVVYTGAIDELFDYNFGILPYRSLLFDFKSIESDSFQNAAIVAYPQEKGYTRITEYTKMPYQYCNGWTSIAYEYPVSYNRAASVGNEPYYPVLTEASLATYSKYKEYADLFLNLILCGRLADFKYYNMDQVILRALEVYEQMEV